MDKCYRIKFEIVNRITFYYGPYFSLSKAIEVMAEKVAPSREYWVESSERVVKVHTRESYMIWEIQEVKEGEW